MMIIDRLRRDVPILRVDDTVAEAAKWILASGVPALPVAKADGRLHGIFGEREFIHAIFPGYVSELKFAGFVRQSLDDAIKRRSGRLLEPVGRYANRERIAVREDYAAAQLAETFLHHRVLIVPIVDPARHVRGVVTRSDFFATLVARAGVEGPSLPDVLGAAEPLPGEPGSPPPAGPGQGPPAAGPGDGGAG